MAVFFGIVGVLQFLMVGMLLINTALSESKADYFKQRQRFLNYEKVERTGGNLEILSDKEVKVNQILMNFKQKEFNISHSDSFPPSRHFFHAKQDIDNSHVFRILKIMPKGAALHLHDSSLVNVSWLVFYATYLDNCYMCFDKQQLKFKFAKTTPNGSDSCKWELTKVVRNRYVRSLFDTWLYYNMSLETRNPETMYQSQHAVWERFYSLFDAISGLVFYKPVFEAYFLEALKEFYDDNVQYIEFRGLLQGVYDLDGSRYTPEWMVSTYENLTKQFVKKYPDFSGSKYIFSSSRSRNYISINNDINKAVALKQKFPNYFLGYDLVGQEDPGHSLKYFLDDLLPHVGKDLQYFFHAGETNWEGRDVDENLIDALLLNTSRIGHGFAMVKHPYAIKVGRAKKVAIEVCPISNQVLKLVDDLRNHPAAALLSTGYPIVISSDDPGLWGANGLSYDFYEAFMGLGGAKADLSFLKQLALNSIQFSGMNDFEKKDALTLWNKKWVKFLDNVIKMYS